MSKKLVPTITRRCPISSDNGSRISNHRHNREGQLAGFCFTRTVCCIAQLRRCGYGTNSYLSGAMGTEYHYLSEHTGIEPEVNEDTGEKTQCDCRSPAQVVEKCVFPLCLTH